MLLIQEFPFFFFGGFYVFWFGVATTTADKVHCIRNIIPLLISVWFEQASG